MDWLWPIARFWEDAGGEPGVGWDLLLPERREVKTERIVGASLETLPSRLSGSIDEEVKVTASSDVKQPWSASCVTSFAGWSLALCHTEPPVTHQTPRGLSIRMLIIAKQSECVWGT